MASSLIADLPDWLSACGQHCRAPSVSHMLQGTSKFITREYAGVSDIKEAEEIAKTARSSTDRLEAALATIEAEATIKGAIITDLVSRVKQGTSHRRGWGLVRRNLGPTRWSALAVRLSAQGTIGLGVCFDIGHQQTRSLPWPGFNMRLNGPLATQGCRMPLTRLSALL
jgi:hypothetical protein